jgi:hypothetical protein
MYFWRKIQITLHTRTSEIIEFCNWLSRHAPDNVHALREHLQQQHLPQNCWQDAVLSMSSRVLFNTTSCPVRLSHALYTFVNSRVSEHKTRVLEVQNTKREQVIELSTYTAQILAKESSKIRWVLMSRDLQMREVRRWGWPFESQQAEPPWRQPKTSVEVDHTCSIWCLGEEEVSLSEFWNSRGLSFVDAAHKLLQTPWISRECEESRKKTAPYNTQEQNKRFIKPLK